MSYTPTQWNSGDTVTATKLNKIEQALASGGNGGMIINYDLAVGETGTLDKTFAEIHDAMLNGTPCYIRYVEFGSGETEETPIGSSFIRHCYLEPVVCLMKYESVYRVYSSGVAEPRNIGNEYNIGLPLLRIFTATATTDYPTLYRKVIATTTSVSVDGGNW